MRILAYSDMHMSTRNRAKHKSYPDECLFYFQFITEKAEELGVDAIIGFGDLATGNFNNLKFRLIFEELLERQYKLTDGKRYELRGNHDIMAGGLSEHDFYVSKGLIKEATVISGKNAVVEMLNYGDAALYMGDDGVKLKLEDGKTHIVLHHDFIRFKTSKTPNYGDGYFVEDLVGFNGAEWIIGGHIHCMFSDRGMNAAGRDTTIVYPGAMTRHVNRNEGIQEKAALVVIDTDAEKDGIITFYEVELSPIEVSFDLQRMEADKRKEVVKREIHEVGAELRQAVQNTAIGEKQRTAYELISANTSVSIEVRDKALQYLRDAQRSTDVAAG
jgi:DNA repair exonuclease SbcCD nuclease subunit